VKLRTIPKDDCIQRQCLSSSLLVVRSSSASAACRLPPAACCLLPAGPRGLVQVSAPIADENITEEARQAVMQFGAPTTMVPAGGAAGSGGGGQQQSKQHDL
jgi:hypothetical protein